MIDAGLFSNSLSVRSMKLDFKLSSFFIIEIDISFVSCFNLKSLILKLLYLLLIDDFYSNELILGENN